MVPSACDRLVSAGRSLNGHAAAAPALRYPAGPIVVLRWKLRGGQVNARSWLVYLRRPVSTTVKPQPGPGWPRLVLGTLKVIRREISFALIVIEPRVVPPAST